MTINEVHAVDKSGMYKLATQFADQLIQGKKIAEDSDIPYTLDHIQNIVVAGMGGSAIAGDLVRCLSASTSPIPLLVVRNYTLPAFVNERSLVIISSFSGNTEETLSALGAALGRNARVLCITSGGNVEQVAEEKNLPCIKIPGGIPPRAALGFSLSVLLVVLHRLGVCDTSSNVWEEALSIVKGKIDLYSQTDVDHQAVQVASQLVGKLPLILSASGALDAVNVRWRGQIQENSKMLAYGNYYPELNHNEIMGWESANGNSIHNQLGVVVLRDSNDHARNAHRMRVTHDILHGLAGSWIEVESDGNHALSRMLSLIVLGDWVSLYLAYLREVDPTPIGFIDRLKNELAKV